MAGFANKKVYDEWMNRLEMMGCKTMNEYHEKVLKKYLYLELHKEFPNRGFFWGRKADIKRIANLITDMTLKGATKNEIKKAVKYSAIAIDAEKHLLDWKKARKDFGIEELIAKYQ